MTTWAVAPEDPLAMSAIELVSAIRGRRTSVVETIERHLRRIERCNPEVNAIVTLRAEPALADAAAADRALLAGDPGGPLLGVPFTVKDLIATRGLRSTAGSRVLAEYVPAVEAPAVERLRQAGAILVGKANCPEFGFDTHTTNELFGDTRNPWDVGLTSGGSSGGDSAAVAAGMVTFGVGTDYGGSIRWPAHCTGLAGLRPSGGLVPDTGQLPFPDRGTDTVPSLIGAPPPPSSLSIQGQLQRIAPIARYIDDAWLVTRTMAGPDGLDPHAVPVAPGDPEDVVLSTLRCACFSGDGSVLLDDEVLAAVDRAADVLRQRGVQVQEKAPPGIERAASLLGELRAADGLSDHLALVGEDAGMVGSSLRYRLARVRDASVVEFRRLGAERDALRAGVLEFLRTRDVLLTTVAAVPAFAIGAGEPVVDGQAIDRRDALNPSRAVTLLGLPAAVVSAGVTVGGVPVGVQVVGRPFEDHVVVAVARAIERVLGLWPPTVLNVIGDRA